MHKVRECKGFRHDARISEWRLKNRPYSLSKMKMKKEHGKLVFIKDLIEQVRIGIDAGVRVDKVIINFYYPGFGIEQQKQVIKDLKKIKAILNYRQDQDGFVISKPAKNVLLKYLSDLEAEVIPSRADKPVTGKLQFNEETGQILFGSIRCQIPINTNQYFLCRKMFSVALGTPVKEIDILDMIDWARDTKRSVYDAMLAVNKKAKQNLGIEKLFKWNAGRVWVNHSK